MVFDVWYKKGQVPEIIPLHKTLENDAWRSLEVDYLMTASKVQTYTEPNSGRWKMEKKIQIQPVLLVNILPWDFSYFNLMV